MLSIVIAIIGGNMVIEKPKKWKEMKKDWWMEREELETYGCGGGKKKNLIIDERDE